MTKKILLGDFEISPGTCEISLRSSPGESRKAYSYHFSGSFQRFKATKMRWSNIRVLNVGQRYDKDFYFIKVAKKVEKLWCQKNQQGKQEESSNKEQNVNEITKKK